MFMEKTINNTEDIFNRITDEVNNVKSFLLEAKQAIISESYDDAVHFLQKAESISTCSYCKQKLQKFIYDTEHMKNICRLKYKICSDDRNNLISEINQFYNKLPDIAEIRKNKVMSSKDQQQYPGDDDLTKYILEAVMAPVNALGEMWNNLIKDLNK